MNHLYSLSFNKISKPFCMVCVPRGFSLPLLKALPVSSRGRHQHYKPEHLKAAANWNIQEHREGVAWDAVSSGIVSLGMTEEAASSSAPSISPLRQEPRKAHFKQSRQTQTLMKLFRLATNM